MFKIIYLIRDDFIQKSVYEAAEQEGVIVIPFKIGYGHTDEDVQRWFDRWGEEQVDLVLCRGSVDERLRKAETGIPIVAIQFAFESTLAILWNYRKEHPGFFGKELKRVLLLSSKPLMLDKELLEEMFHIEVVAKHGFHPFEKEEDKAAVLALAEGKDLIICGTKLVELLKEHGFNGYHSIVPEVQTLRDNFRLAKEICRSQVRMKEKNEEIQNILDNSFHAILILEKDGSIVGANGQIRRYFQKDARDLLDQNIGILLSEEKIRVIRDAFSHDCGFYGEIVETEDKVLVMNAFPILQDGEVIRLGVHFEELAQIEKVEQRIQSELYRKGLIAKYTFDDIVGKSRELQETINYAKNFAHHSANVLLYGESGTGKELLAQSIHNQSTRKNGPFVAINCGALPQSLLESELFGYVGGAFTGANKNGKKGLLELANKGTIFLDEISEMDQLGQIRLLRVLEERVITRIGDDHVIPVDLRIIAASNKNLRKLVEEGKFREDLYYRLNVLMLKIPPLRERNGDIRILGDLFLHRYGEINKKRVDLEEKAWHIMERYPWRGNVRQLRNFCERLVVIADRRVLSWDMVLRQINDSYFEKMSFPEPVEGTENGEEKNGTEKIAAREIETEHIEVIEIKTSAEKQKQTKPIKKKQKQEEELKRIREALEQTGGNREEAANLLGMGRTSLWRKMKQYGLLG